MGIDGCDATNRYGSCFMLELMPISDAFAANMLDRHKDCEDIRKTGRGKIITVGRDTRKANRLSILYEGYRQTAAIQKVRFGDLHEAEELRKVHDPGHVRIAELDPALSSEWFTHGRGSR
jgi:hypothetical protein